MDLVIIEGLDITINLAEIALMKAIRVDNPHYIPAIPRMEIKEQGGQPYFEKTEITLKSGEKVVIELPYSDMVLVIKKWMSIGQEQPPQVTPKAPKPKGKANASRKVDKTKK